MRRRLLAATAALLLALLGAAVLVGYARGADRRAMAGLATVPVLVVGDQPIPAGTPADKLTGLVRTEQLPARAAVPGAVRDLTTLAGRVATVDLQPGEQLLAARFGRPGEVRTPGTVPVPAGDQEVSVQLEPQRALGGRLAAGDTVGVFISLTGQDGGGSTSAVLHRVLVTQVQGAVPAPSDAADAKTAAASAPTGNLLVTFATSAKDAEAIVFGAEHGKLWLSLEPQGADTGGTTVITNGNVYTEAYP